MLVDSTVDSTAGSLVAELVDESAAWKVGMMADSSDQLKVVAKVGLKAFLRVELMAELTAD